MRRYASLLIADIRNPLNISSTKGRNSSEQSDTEYNQFPDGTREPYYPLLSSLVDLPGIASGPVHLHVLKERMPKRSLRSQLLAERRALSHHAWLASSRSAQRNLLLLQEYSLANCIALYAAVHQEVDTAEIMAAAFESGKRVLYPALCGKQMVFRQVLGLDMLQEGAFGILEPCLTGIEHQADEPDLIVVPGVAFDLSGHRIGYGKGYYDRFLKHPGRKAHLVGLCHDFQLIGGAIPADRHDIRMEIIVSDRRIIYSRSNRSCIFNPDSHTGGY